MSSKARFVFDTNVLISALLFRNSKPGQALRLAVKRGDILLSKQTLEELNEVLSRPKFDRYVTSEEKEEFLEALVERAILVEPTEEVQVCRDGKDDKFIELALSGKANFIVSGDEDLLVLNPFGEVCILKPEDFLQRFTQSDAQEHA
ncbi:putative toxin-antitoxin system toxin component, PIN family [Iningainema tapete]|uniref:Putative toxin-antitoxin system toxin component, PIN family n=1 Tax=Iningainema tapete BLCC-T55 TaxID=2748662 RepID=A0A8J6XKI9_9CYAN|nr:putative toxin-antitoxin system toxin component, PIN family [Iningainema tapete]MBD2774385.1 putative toxin-antitoxin system toxin component, PIN family [Iningainema tapete BLCC-T55]